MRVQDGSTGANQVHYLFADHLGSTNVTYNTANSSSTAQRYYPWGTVRPGPGNTLPTGYTFTGQLDSGVGLMYYGARFYDGALGRFIQPDTIVPEPGDPQALNRYSYVLNNPLRYTDPTGHLTEDELRTLLGSNYDTLITLWSQYDTYWMAVLEAIQGGGVLQASMLGGIELHFEGSGRDIRLNVYNGSHSKQLWDWQGKGVYRVQNPGMTSADADRFRDQLFNSSENTGMANTVVVPVFDYARRVNGRIQPTYLGAQMVNQSVGDWQWSSVSAVMAKSLNLPESVGIASNLIVPSAVKVWLGLSFPGGLAVGALNVAIGSVVATYQAPNNYLTGWPGVIEINPYIDRTLIWP